MIISSYTLILTYYEIHMLMSQFSYLLLSLLREEGHELLVAVHVDDRGGGRDDDAGEEVEQHRDRGVQQERLILVQHILWPNHVHLQRESRQ